MCLGAGAPSAAHVAPKGSRGEEEARGEGETEGGADRRAEDAPRKEGGGLHCRILQLTYRQNA